jgi:hypothetical protein
MITFIHDLAITLSLTIGGQAYTVSEGNIKSLELDLDSYGFKGNISFEVMVEGSTDDFFTPITTQKDLIELSLNVQELVKDTDSTITPTPLTLSGLVTTRSFSEKTLTNVLPTQTLIISRLYSLTFADPAQVLWKQHYPCDLFVDSTLKTLITAHTSSKIDLTYDWPVLETTHPVLSLSLGASNNQAGTPNCQASFYDYIIWLVDTQDGVFSYDCTNNQYTLSASKSQEGTAQSLNALEVSTINVIFPEVPRHQPKVLNAYTESASITAVTNSNMESPTRHDYIGRYPIASDGQARVTLETARLKERSHEVAIEYKQFPLNVTPPGQLVDFQGSSAWSSSLFVQPNTYRVRKWHLSARWVKQGEFPGHSCYDMEHSIYLESKTEPWVDLPSYLLPAYPFFVEGKIVSEVGADDEATYQFYTDSETSTNYYYTKIPLWENKKVRTAYLPNKDTGQFYFPPYKHQRVLIGLNFNHAFINAFLDWGNSTALPQDSLANHVVMGKTPTNRNTIKHSYIDNKPDLQIQRIMDKDTELLQFSDGYIIIRTQLEEGE